jgi:hypothetical protein
MTLQVEDAAIYSWSAGDAITPPAAVAPVSYDALNGPLVLGIADSGETANWSGIVDDDGNLPDDNATPASNLQINARLTTDAAGYNFTGTGAARAAGTTNPPTAWVVASSAASWGANQVILPLSPVSGGRKVFIEFRVLRTSTLSTLTFAANVYNALTGSGIGPIASGSIVPTASGVWQTFKFSGTVNSEAGFIGLTYESLTGNGGRVEIADATVSYSESGADVTSASQVVVTVPALVTYDADYLGTLIGSLSSESVRVARGGTSIKLANDTTYAITINGGITATIDNTNGSGTKGDITPTAFSGNSATIDVVVTVDGVAQPKQTITFQKALANPPASGGSGSKVAYDTALTRISATTDTVMSDVLTVTVASAESLYGSAPLDCEVSGTTTASRTASVKWQRSPAGGGTWTDFVASTYVTGSAGESGKFVSGEWIDPVLGFVAGTQTATTPGAGDYDVRLVGKLDATGRTMAFFGTATIEAKV